MQSWGKVSSIPGANTLFEGATDTDKTERYKRHRDKDTEERSPNR
jgi:hypothetical protein